VTVGAQELMVYSTVLVMVEVVHGASELVHVGGEVMTEVITEEVLDPTGQLVTVGAHEVMVYSMVSVTVEVDHGVSLLAGAVQVAEVSVAVTGQIVTPTEVYLVTTSPAVHSVYSGAHEVTVLVT